MTLVSIITPSFNQASYLEQTIQSVLNQDYADIEYIVIDGDSTDGSVDIIKKYASHLAYWVSEKDSGQAEAINKGMARAKGEIVAWLNSDDYYLSGTVRAAVAALEQNPDVVLVYADMLAVNEHGQTFNNLRYRQLTLKDLFCFQIIGQPAVFLRRAAFENSGGLDPSFHFLLDHHLWIRIAAQERILHVPQTWAAARYHAAAKNRAQTAAFGREAFRILDWAKTRPEFSKLVGARARAAAHACAHHPPANRPGASQSPWLGFAEFGRTWQIARVNVGKKKIKFLKHKGYEVTKGFLFNLLLFVLLCALCV
jgi:glycosyltransferase involved in cell wall biosynthesis